MAHVNAQSLMQQYKRHCLGMAWALSLTVLLLFACAGSAFADSLPGVIFSEVNAKSELTDNVAAITGTSVHLKGEVNPEGGPSATEWEFSYASKAQFQKGEWTPVPGAAGSLPGTDSNWHVVEASLTGLTPGTVYYARLTASNAGGEIFSPGGPTTGSLEYGLFITTDRPGVSTIVTHALNGKEMRAIGEINPGGASTDYHFEYVSGEQFARAGFSEAFNAPNVEIVAEPELGAFETNGAQSRIVGENLPGMQPGVTYRYRLVASNEDGSSISDEQTLTVPAPSKEGPVACHNQTFRIGPSAGLPDCRAYEQVTPIEKGGALDIYNYAASSLVSTQLGESGNDVMVSNGAGVDWGPSPDPTLPSYVFSRSPEGWQMVSTHPPGETGVPATYRPTVFSSDFTRVGAEVDWATVVHYVESPRVEFKVGPSGGPYTTVASIPRTQLNPTEGDGWAAASPDGSKFILAAHDHTLLGHPTGTGSGADLYEYEYSTGELRQVNVLSSGARISACGAMIADTRSDSISADGSRVLFTDNCTHHLYVRTDGAQTLDVGEYVLRAADPQGSKLLLEKLNGQVRELVLYDTGTATAKPLLSGGSAGETLGVIASRDLSVVYLISQEQLTPDVHPLHKFSEWAGSSNLANLYRYDLAGETLRFVAQSSATNGFYEPSVSPDGRYFYWGADGVSGVPGGGHYPAGFLLGGEYREEGGETRQIFRYDDAENIVECMSCVSSFDPQPKRPAEFGGSQDYSSANGDYVIFHTVAALLPQDVDNEAPASLETGGEGLNNPEADFFYSASTDVYEWRANGVDGCSDIGGCLALISSGTGGLRNTVLGISPSGHDLFFATHSPLAATDDDRAGDVYDARIEGGFPPPPPAPTECEGDACSTPMSAPIDASPSSFTFTGAGNPVVRTPVKPKKKRKRLKCPKGKKAAHGRCVKRKATKAKKTSTAMSHKDGKRS